jgi:hypothetical protein
MHELPVMVSHLVRRKKGLGSSTDENPGMVHWSNPLEHRQVRQPHKQSYLADHEFRQRRLEQDWFRTCSCSRLEIDTTDLHQWW